MGFTLLFSSCDLFKKKELLARIIAQNICGATIDVYMNGAFQFSVANNTDGYLEELTLGAYRLEAIKTGSNIVVFSSTIDIDFDREYVWVIEGQSGFSIINQTGEAVRIFIDGVDGGQLPDQSTRTVTDVPFGEHVLEAKELNSDTVIATTTINVDLIQVYSWTIT
jgi:hypothetical protein